VKERVHKVTQVLEALTSLADPQVQFVLLHSCIGFPRFNYCLCTYQPSLLSQVYSEFDEAQCAALTNIVGASIAIDDRQWLHAFLPVSLGGLGLRSALAHSSAAFVASITQTKNLVGRIVAPLNCHRTDTTARSILENATANTTTPIPNSPSSDTPQKFLSCRVDETRLHLLLQLTTGDRSKALLQSVMQPHTGDFLNVVPSGNLGLHLHPDVFRCAIEYRLDLPVFPAEAPCPQCNWASDVMGDHAVSACRTSGDRIRHHNLIRDAIFSAASAACLAPKKEEKNILDTAARPGNITTGMGWHRCQGRPTAFDTTVTSPLQNACLRHTIDSPNYVLE
jgi:hypothetical protein